MYDEIKHFFKVNEDIKNCSAQFVSDKIKKLQYCKQVITESLRLSSLAPWSARVNYEEDMLLNCCNNKEEKVLIPKGMAFVIGQGVALTNDDVFDDAMKFDPDRWSRRNLKKNKMIQQSENAMFGGLGGRLCPGWALFKTEALIFLVAAISQFEFELIGHANVGTKYGLLASPSRPIMLKITKRKH